MDDGIAVGIFVDGAFTLMRKRVGRVRTANHGKGFLAHYYDWDSTVVVFDDCVFIFVLYIFIISIEIVFVY